SDVATDDLVHPSRDHFLPADEDDVGGLDHRVRRFDHRDQAAGLDHAEGVADLALVFGVLVSHGSRHSTSGGHRQCVNYALAVDQPHRIHQIRHDAGVIRQDADAIAGFQPRAASDPYDGMFFG